jgi:hypothetical protein
LSYFDLYPAATLECFSDCSEQTDAAGRNGCVSRQAIANAPPFGGNVLRGRRWPKLAAQFTAIQESSVVARGEWKKGGNTDRR